MIEKKLSIVALENLSMIELILNNWVRISIDLDKLATRYSLYKKNELLFFETCLTKLNF